MYLAYSAWSQCVTNNAFILAANSMGVCSDYVFRSASDGECPHSRTSLPPKVFIILLLFSPFFVWFGFFYLTQKKKRLSTPNWLTCVLEEKFNLLSCLVKPPPVWLLMELVCFVFIFYFYFYFFFIFFFFLFLFFVFCFCFLFFVFLFCFFV